MNKHSLRKILALLLSIFLHFIILLFSYKNSGEGRIIPISSIHFVKVKSRSQGSSDGASRKKNNSDTISELKPKTEEKPTKSIKKESTEETLIDNEDKNISEENIYKKSSGDASFVELEIVGWDIDSFPKIDDDSPEVGKIVFEITIDDEGYVIGVKTLEKTVTNVVEEIYKKGVFAFTFSKNSDSRKNQPITKGKITFNIKYKI